MDHKPVRGRFSFSVGETLLTSWEAGTLAPGDIVLTSREAGYPGFVLFNNLPLGVGEVVVLDGTLGVRVVDTDFRPSFSVDPGRVDELGEVLPAVIELGSFDVDLESLRGLGRNSLINLGSADGSPNAVLRYAGVALARGTVMVVGELMGFRVDERLVAATPGGRIRQSGNLSDATTSVAKVYDFSRPDKFSVTQIRRLGEIHRLFQRHLESALPSVASLLGGRTDALLVDQCTLGEARSLLAAEGLPLAATWEHGGRARASSRNEAPPRYFETDDCPRPASPRLRAWLATLQEGKTPAQRPVFLHAAREWSSAELEVAADALRMAWKKYLDFAIEALAEGIGPANDLDAGEMVILIVLRPRADGRPELALVYPALVLEPYLNLLGS